MSKTMFRGKLLVLSTDKLWTIPNRGKSSLVKCATVVVSVLGSALISIQSMSVMACCDQMPLSSYMRISWLTMVHGWSGLWLIMGSFGT